MADIFVSYTSGDKAWAEWIGHELEKLGHTPHLHDWEISGGGDLAEWMEKHHHAADHVLCVVSAIYLDKPYSAWERRSAQWTATTKRPNFVLPVFVEDCEPPTMFAPLKCCQLFGLDETAAHERLDDFLKPASEKKPAKALFPGGPAVGAAAVEPRQAPVFPGTISNIPIRVPEHFLGRNEAMAALETALAREAGKAAITALHGLKGVGKTTLAAAFAEKHRGAYRATWWLRAQTEPTLRADLAGLGVRLKWIDPNAKEQEAVAAVLERLRFEGDGILLVYDNAVDAASLRPYLPRGGAAKIIVTSNDPNWRGVAAPVEIRIWPKDIGADYLIARTGFANQRAEAEALSVALGGLPLAHEQAGAYCEQLQVDFADYRRRFEHTPAKFLDDEDHAPADHNDRETVAKSFALGIEQAARLHPAAEPLIVHAALLAPEPIPYFFLEELFRRTLLPDRSRLLPTSPSDSQIGNTRFASGEGVARSATDEGDALTRPGSAGPPSPASGRGMAPEDVAEDLDKAVAALRQFALVDLETIADERDAAQQFKTIKLHRLVRLVAALPLPRSGGGLGRGPDARRALIEAMRAAYPEDVFENYKSWPRARGGSTLWRWRWSKTFTGCHLRLRNSAIFWSIWPVFTFPQSGLTAPCERFLKRRLRSRKLSTELKA